MHQKIYKFGNDVGALSQALGYGQEAITSKFYQKLKEKTNTGSFLRSMVKANKDMEVYGPNLVKAKKILVHPAVPIPLGNEIAAGIHGGQLASHYFRKNYYSNPKLFNTTNSFLNLIPK